ncbi:MAG TPA: pirin family protein [Polyangiaceae bacterium]
MPSFTSEAIELVLDAKIKDVAGTPVRRALPQLQRRAVGPFVFFDHFGPTDVPAGAGMEVPPHPHIGLATVTYLFEGDVLHRDSLGSAQRIVPGDVNWMTAGRGIVHSERMPDDRRDAPSRSHGLQLWVALPIAREDCEPTFAHHPKVTLPSFRVDDAEARLVVGVSHGHTSPVIVDWTMFYLDCRLPGNGTLRVTNEHAERAAYVVEGNVECDGGTFGAGQMIVFRSGKEAVLRAISDAHVMLLGGEPLEAKRIMWWNFVSSDQAKIDRAKKDWKEGRFPKVVGDAIEFVPLPER